MCGITGFFQWSGGDHAAFERRITAMNNAQSHRGPDAAQIWVDGEAGIALGHRRLAIVDLSPTGLQPMNSACGRWTVCYNGEIYNHQDLRVELEAAGKKFRGSSDTEVMLEAVTVWGVQETVSRLIGMFAIALWDHEQKSLWLVRDRLGIKPLYWTKQAGEILFGSELKSLVASGGVERRVDQAALSQYLRFAYVPAPRTIYDGVHKLEPGCLLQISADGTVREQRFWGLEEVAKAGQATRREWSDQEATDALEELLQDAVQRRMMADVPLGAFLSGGVDSSTIVALMQKASTQKIRTFTIGFDVKGYNEAEHAKAVAEHLGTDHTELYVQGETAQQVIPKLGHIYDEPFADSSQIPTYLVSQMTRNHVTVALSGDGGDEVFAGYTRYAMAETFRRRLSGVPTSLRHVAAAGIRSLSPNIWNRLGRALPDRIRPPQLGDRLHKLAAVLPLDETGFYRRLVSHMEQPSQWLINGQEPASLIDDPRASAVVPDFVERMTYWDLQTYLPDDILTKVDRASMAVALEARVPILDHRVVEFGWSLPLSLKIRGGQGKWLLRQVLYRHVPSKLIERPKAGFAIPLDHWLRGPLKEWAGDLLSEDRIRAQGVFDPAIVGQHWKEHQSGSRNWQYALWLVLMYQAWQEEWL